MATVYTRASKGSALTWAEGDANITNLNTAKIENVIEDLTPQLGGDLDVNGKLITSTSNGNIRITPDGTGSIVLDGQNWPQSAPATNNQYLKANADGSLGWTDSVTAKTIYENVKNVSGGSLSKGTPVYQVGVSGNTITVGAARADDPAKLAVGVLNETIANDAEGQMIVLGEIKGVDTSTFTAGDKVYLGTTGGYTNVAPTGSTVARQFLGLVNRVDSTQGSGFITGTLVEDSVKWTGTAFELWDGDSWVALSSGGNITLTDDTSTNATRYILFDDATSGSVSEINVSSTKLTYNPSTGTLSTTVLSDATLNKYKETVYAGGSQASAYTPNWNNGSVQSVTLTGNVTFGLPTNMATGSSLTLILTQDGTGGRTGEWNASYKWLGGTPTLSTAANSIDVVNVFYDGTNYISGFSKQDGTLTNVQLNAQGELRLADSDSSNYVGFKSPATVSTNKVWTLPSTDGTNGQVLSTNGSGVLSWATAGGGGLKTTILQTDGHVQVSGSTYRIQYNSTIFYESENFITLADSNRRFTLGAGTYIFNQDYNYITHTSFTTTLSNIILYNVTTSSTQQSSFYFVAGTGTTIKEFFIPFYKLTLASTTTFEIRYNSDNPIAATVPSYFVIYKL